MAKSHSIVILDAHRSPLDIIMTAAWARHKYHPTHLLMPIAGYVFYVPVMSNLVKYFGRRYQIDFQPVYRRVEYTPINLLMRLLVTFYPPTLTPEARELANQAYVTHTLEAVKRGDSVIIVAPFGSPALYGGKVKYGVRQLLDQSPHALVTRSRFNLFTLSYHTQFKTYDQSVPMLSQYAELDYQS